MLSSSRVYVGGSVNPRALLGARVHNNFVGCLRKVSFCKKKSSIEWRIGDFFFEQRIEMDLNNIFQVEFSADTLRLNLIDLARTGSKLIQVAGRVAYNCPSGDPQDPVTFTTRDSHLVNSYLLFRIGFNSLVRLN